MVPLRVICVVLDKIWFTWSFGEGYFFHIFCLIIVSFCYEILHTSVWFIVTSSCFIQSHPVWLICAPAELTRTIQEQHALLSACVSAWVSPKGVIKYYLLTYLLACSLTHSLTYYSNSLTPLYRYRTFTKQVYIKSCGCAISRWLLISCYSCNTREYFDYQ